MTHRVLPDLPYAATALEPHIGARTTVLHHDMHHGGYVRALNEALSAAPQALQDQSAEWLLTHLEQIPAEIRAAVHHSAGGHLNHSLFWRSMTAHSSGAPSGALASAITRDFGSFDDFQLCFEKAGRHPHDGAGIAQDARCSILRGLDFQPGVQVSDAKFSTVFMNFTFGGPQ